MSTQAYIAEQQIYTPGFHMAANDAFKSERGLSRKIVEQISEMKGEPEWTRKQRLQSLALFEKRPMPTIVNGFIEPIIKELPMEYAVELNRLIQWEMSGSVG